MTPRVRRLARPVRGSSGTAWSGPPVRPFAVAVAFVLSLSAVDAGQALPGGRDPRVERLVTSISTTHLREMLTTLVSFGTRSTLSRPDSTTRGIRAAPPWIAGGTRRAR